MLKLLPALLLGAAPVRAAVVENAPRLSPLAAAVSAPAVLGAAALSAPSALLAPSAAVLSAPALAPASALPAALAPSAAPLPAPAASAAAALSARPAPSDGPGHESVEQAAAAASRVWDGFGNRRASDDAADALPARAASASPALGKGWRRGSFQSASGGVSVAYKRREGPKGAVPRVYAGGLALNESFDPLFARPGATDRPEYFVWTRGHPPTDWTPTRTPIDADARDLARMIVIAARETGAPKVEVALHSFGTLVFQRMIQLSREPEVREALKLLAGSRVTLLNATTHYEGSEERAGQSFVQMGQATKSFVGWLDTMDQAADAWRAAAELNPLLGPFVAAGTAAWRVQRENLLALASKGAADMMKADLREPWDPGIDGIRRAFIAALAHDSRDSGWQESLLRRSSDMFRLEFSPKDAALIRRLKIRLDLVHSAGDQLLNWASAQTLFERLGIPAPADAPAAGTVLTDETGLFRAEIVDGDHYWPLKKRDELARRLQ